MERRLHFPRAAYRFERETEAPLKGLPRVFGFRKRKIGDFFLALKRPACKKDACVNLQRT